MNRLNLTLDDATWIALERHARTLGQARATTARSLIEEALAHRGARERRRKLSADYAADREDVATLLADIEAPQLGLLDDVDL